MRLNSDYTVFDSWYTSLDNLWQLKKMGWRWFTRMKENRLVCTATEEFRAISDFEIPAQERVVQLKDYGPVKVFRTVREDGGPVLGDQRPEDGCEEEVRARIDGMGHRGLS